MHTISEREKFIYRRPSPLNRPLVENIAYFIVQILLFTSSLQLLIEITWNIAMQQKIFHLNPTSFLGMATLLWKTAAWSLTKLPFRWSKFLQIYEKFMKLFFYNSTFTLLT